MHHVHAARSGINLKQRFKTTNFLLQFVNFSILKLERALCSLVFIELLGNQDPANEEDLYGRHMTKQCIWEALFGFCSLFLTVMFV